MEPDRTPEIIDIQITQGANTLIHIMKMMYSFEIGAKVILMAAAYVIKAGRYGCKNHTEEKLMDFFQDALKSAEITHAESAEKIEKDEKNEKDATVNITKLILGIKD